MSKEIDLVNSDKTVTVDSCCAAYIGSFIWRMMADGRAARIEPCPEDAEHPHIIYMETEIAERHVCDMEQQEGIWDEDRGTACYECPAEIGQPHSAGCPIAICLVTGEQRINCKSRHDCGSDAWTGDFPGTAEAIEYGFFSKWVDDTGKVIDPPDWKKVKGHWEETTAADPDGDPDTELMMEQCIWDRKLGRWVLRGTKM